jgi:hypothetical protein
MASTARGKFPNLQLVERFIDAATGALPATTRSWSNQFASS